MLKIKNKILYILISIATALTIFNINSTSFAKYTFNYTIDAAKVEIIV